MDVKQFPARLTAEWLLEMLLGAPTAHRLPWPDGVELVVPVGGEACREGLVPESGIRGSPPGRNGRSEWAEVRLRPVRSAPSLTLSIGAGTVVPKGPPRS